MLIYRNERYSDFIRSLLRHRRGMRRIAGSRSRGFHMGRFTKHCPTLIVI